MLQVHAIILEACINAYLCAVIFLKWLRVHAGNAQGRVKIITAHQWKCGNEGVKLLYVLACGCAFFMVCAETLI